MPCISDPNVWRVVDSKTKQLVALVSCYVDDLLIVGPRAERDSFLSRLREVWDCSQPEHSEDGVVSYCGLEISSVVDGLQITQENA